MKVTSTNEIIRCNECFNPMAKLDEDTYQCFKCNITVVKKTIYKIKGLPADHIAQKEFNKFTNDNKKWDKTQNLK